MCGEAGLCSAVDHGFGCSGNSDDTDELYERSPAVPGMPAGDAPRMHNLDAFPAGAFRRTRDNMLGRPSAESCTQSHAGCERAPRQMRQQSSGRQFSG